MSYNAFVIGHVLVDDHILAHSHRDVIRRKACHAGMVGAWRASRAVCVAYLEQFRPAV